MINIILKILLPVICFQFTSCSKKTESYYISTPYQKNEIQKFKSKTTNDFQLWNITRSEKGNYIKTRRLNSQNQFIDQTTERITKNGSELISYELNRKNDINDSNIIFYPKEKDLLKWDLSKKSIYTGEFINNGILFQFKREREFFKKEKQVLLFKDSYELKPSEGYPFKNQKELYHMNFSQISYFEKNQGLVKFERHYSNGKKEIFERVKN